MTRIYRIKDNEFTLNVILISWSLSFCCCPDPDYSRLFGLYTSVDRDDFSFDELRAEAAFLNLFAVLDQSHHAGLDSRGLRELTYNV